jgi:hypothetical protein
MNLKEIILSIFSHPDSYPVSYILVLESLFLVLTSCFLTSYS